MSTENATTFARWRDLAGEVFQSWIREWLRLATEAKAWLMDPIEDQTTALFESSDVLIQRPDGSPPYRIALRDDFDSPISLLATQLDGVSGVTVLLPEHGVLRPTLRLPNASRGILRKALQFELARLSPIPVDQLYFDFKIGPSSPARGDREIQLRAIRKSTVDAAVAKCRAAGASVAAIGFAGDPLPADWQTFPVDRAAFLLAQARRWSVPGLCVLACILTALLTIAVYARGQAALAAIDAQIAQAHDHAVIAERLRVQVGTVAQMQSFLAAEKHKPMLIAELAELSRVLPDDTWISDFQLNGKRIRIQGTSRSAPHLIGLIDGSSSFSNAQFQSPLTQDPSNRTERFDLSFEVVR